MQVAPPESPLTTPPKSMSLVGLGNLVRARTTDFIAITIIIILGITVGQQLSIWWQVDKSDIIQNPANQALPLTNWDQLNSPVSIQFGEHHELVREEFLGSREIVFPKIIDRCLSYTQNCQGVSATNETTSATAWKTSLRDHKPIVADDRGHAIYSVDGPFPLLIGITGYDSTTKLQYATIVCVAYYAQIQPEHWKLNISRSKNAQPVKPDQTIPGVPPNCQIGLSLKNQTGDSITQFTGQSTLAQCWDHFDTWAEKNKLIREFSPLSAEQQLYQRVYKSVSRITPKENPKMISDENHLTPVPDEELIPLNQKQIKILIQIRQDRDKLHGMIHTFPLTN